MLEIRFHGRGGQGTVVATILLAKAFFKAGYQVQSFPVFGVERRGAPVEAYLRVDKEQIFARTNVYAPDHLIVQDQTLLRTVQVTKGLKPGGWVLVNCIDSMVVREYFSGFHLACIDANRIALRYDLGTRTHPIVNTAMIGAFARVMNMPPINTVADAIQEEISEATSRNIKAAEEAYKTVKILGMIETRNVV